MQPSAWKEMYANFVERRKSEVQLRRTPLLGNRVNKRPGSKEMRSYSTNVGLPFLIIHTAGADRKLPLPAFLVILPAVPLYSVMRRTYVKMSCPLSKPSTNILNES